MVVRAFLAVWILAAVALAGCAEDDAGPTGAAQAERVLRGVVVDAAIRPLAGASIEAQGNGQTLNATTDQDGLFLVAGVQPGVYILTVSKPFYDTRQVSATVPENGEPALVKVDLSLTSGLVPFSNVASWEGFLECSATIGNWCGIANLYPCIVQSQVGQPCSRVSNDQSFNFQQEFFTDLNRAPDWLQFESYWESTQSVSSNMAIRFAATNQSEWNRFSFGPVLASPHGPSPLIAFANGTALAEAEVGTDRGVTTELFHGGPDAYTLGEQCADTPIGRGCFDGQWAGVAANQRITIVYIAFYGYTPPEGWTYAAEGRAPPP
jgi:hypothetical protein